MKFIDQLADKVFEVGIPFENLTIVLPSIRAKRYLEQALVKRLQQPSFAPEIITIDRWVVEQSGLNMAEPTELMFLLYEVHQKLVPADEDGSFDAFQSWGKTLLSDFDEIERYLVEPEQLFKNLRDIREIENWSFGEDRELSPAQQRFLLFWDQLKDYYFEFQTLLQKRGLAFPGKAFRKLANDVNQVFKDRPDQQFIFAGFNALSLAEMKIIKDLLLRNRATLLQDNDKFYVESAHHEAGYFQRKIKQYLGLNNLPMQQDRLLKEAKTVELIECSQPSSQVHAAATILSELPTSEMSETLLLLGDEDLVGPMIKNLPMNIGKANITMGIELSKTSLKMWMELFFSVQENFDRYQTKAIYFKDLFKFWHHPFYQALSTPEEIHIQQKKEQDILKYNKLFLSKNYHDFETPIKKKLIDLLYENWDGDWVKCVDIFLAANELIFEQLTDQWTLEKAGIRAFHESLTKLKGILKKGYPEMGIRTFHGIFQQHCGSAKIAFEGNPTDGLQIMGLLETRLLDFERVIILGMNEGKLPNDNPIQSLIPMDLRAGFQLPTNRDKQGLFAHHFYRLLHQPKHITMTYSFGKSDLGTDEPSRYIQQLELEWIKLNPNIQFQRKQFELAVDPTVQPAVSVEKTPEILARMDEMFAQSMSTSAINKFLTCPLDFYYRYVMGLGEEDLVEEELNASSFGSIIHEVLERMFTPFAETTKDGERNPNAKSLHPLDIEKMKGQVEPEIRKEFMAHYNQDEKAFMQGKNYLSYQISIRLTHRFLDEYKAYLAQQTEPVHVVGLERSFKVPIDCTIHGTTKTFMLYGFIDRIDRIGEKLRVIDYKSGKVASEKLQIAKGKKGDSSLERLVQTIRKGHNSHVLQLLIYAYMIRKTMGYDAQQLSIISFVNYPEEGLDLDGGDVPISEWVDLLPEALGIVLSDLYDVNVPFSHEPKANYCLYCS